MRSLLRDLQGSFHNTRFWALSAWLNIVTSARTSRLGFVWLLLPSFLYIWGIGFLYSFIFHEPMSTYALFVAIGTIVFRLITGTMTSATTTYRGAKSFIMDGHVRLSDFVLRGISNTLFAFIMSLPATAIALAIYPQFNALGLLMGLAAFPLVLINLLWVGIVFSLIGARHPDFGHIIPNLFMFFYLATPIIWTPNHIEGTIRGKIMGVNPFYYLIETVRAPIMHGHYDARAMIVTAVMAVVGSLIAVLAYRRWATFVPLWI